MKKLTLAIIIGLLFIFAMTPTIVSARAGGSMGSSSTSSSSTSSSDYNDNNYYGYRRYGGYGRGRFSLMDVFFIGVTGLLAFRSIKRKRQENYTLPETYDELTPHVKEHFEPFFYRVEDAWTKNDLETLKTLMSPYYFGQQKRIINGYIRNHKVDHLEGLVIIDLQQVINPDHGDVQVIVTAQARDYFQYDNKTVEYNQQIQDDTNIERFKEIWTLTWQEGNRLLLGGIKVIG